MCRVASIYIHGNRKSILLTPRHVRWTHQTRKPVSGKAGKTDSYCYISKSFITNSTATLRSFQPLLRRLQPPSAVVVELKTVLGTITYMAFF